MLGFPVMLDPTFNVVPTANDPFTVHFVPSDDQKSLAPLPQNLAPETPTLYAQFPLVVFAEYPPVPLAVENVGAFISALAVVAPVSDVVPVTVRFF
jgi:hypothetical protein